MSGRTIASSILSLNLGQVLARLVAFVGATYLARTLGSNGFGVIAFATAIVGYLGLAVSVGFNEIGAREVARAPEKAGSIARSVLALRLLLALGAYAVLGVGVQIWRPDPTLATVVLLTGLLFFPLALDTAWVFKGMGRNRLAGGVMVIAQVVFVGTVLLVVRGPEDVALVPIAQFVGELSAALVLLYVAVTRLPHVTRFSLASGLEILRQSQSLALSRLLRTLIFTFDVVLLGLMLDIEAVGHYNAAYRLCFFVLALSIGVRESYLPHFVRTVSDGRDAMSALASRANETITAIGAPIVVGGILLAGPILEVLFGDEYAPGAPALRLLLLSIGLVFLNTTAHNILLVSGMLRRELGFVAAAALTNVLLNLVLIPVYGLAGAALATVVSQAVVLVASAVAVARMGIRTDLTRSWRALAASAVMGAVVAFLQPVVAVIPLIGLGGATYVVTLVLIRGIPPDLRM